MIEIHSISRMERKLQILKNDLKQVVKILPEKKREIAKQKTKCHIKDLELRIKVQKAIVERLSDIDGYFYYGKKSEGEQKLVKFINELRGESWGES
jgi:hypothetical protein